MPGTVLLLAASPVGKGCLVDAASVLPVLAAVAPAVLSGTETANVVELADPLDPQAVLTRLRAAATAPGPLTMFVTGQLHLDRRQRLPHLALARTTPATVRYTAFPWHWITEELRLRPPGLTSVVVDLHADAEAWDLLSGRPLGAGPATALYGRVAPPPPRRTLARPSYMKAVATLLRSGYRPPPAALHAQALARTEAEEAGRPGPADLVYGSGPYGPAGAAGPGAGTTVPAATAPEPRTASGPASVPGGDPAPAGAATPASAAVAEAGPPAFPPTPGGTWAGRPWPPAPEFAPAESAGTAGSPPVPPYAAGRPAASAAGQGDAAPGRTRPAPPEEGRPDQAAPLTAGEAVGDPLTFGRAWPAPPEEGRPDRAAPLTAGEPAGDPLTAGEAVRDPLTAGDSPTAAGPLVAGPPSHGERSAAPPDQPPVAEGPVPLGAEPPVTAPPPRAAPPGGPVTAAEPSGRVPAPAPALRGSARLDPHETITTAVRAGRHGEALALAGAREEEAARVHGPASEQVLHWMEVRADLAMFAGDPERSCRTWLAVAAARLDAGQSPDAPEVESAVDRAHHQWGRVDAPAPARELGAELAALRLRVPGRREGALDHVRRQLRQLQTQS